MIYGLKLVTNQISQDKKHITQLNSHSDPWLRDEFHWDTFDHPPYSPDLAPSDIHLFLKMKEHLDGKRHADDEDLQHAVVDWLNSQPRAV